MASFIDIRFIGWAFGNWDMKLFIRDWVTWFGVVKHMSNGFSKPEDPQNQKTPKTSILAFFLQFSAVINDPLRNPTKNIQNNSKIQFEFRKKHRNIPIKEFSEKSTAQAAKGNLFLFSLLNLFHSFSS